MANETTGLKLFFTNNVPSGVVLNGIVQTLGDAPIVDASNAVVTSGGTFTDTLNGANATCFIFPSGTTTGAGRQLPKTTSINQSGWLYEGDLTGKTIIPGDWELHTDLRTHNTNNGMVQRLMMRVATIIPSSGGIVPGDIITMLTKFSQTSSPDTEGGEVQQSGWQEPTKKDRDWGTASAVTSGQFTLPNTTSGFANFVFYFPMSGYTFSAGEGLFVQLGAGDGTSITARMPVLQYNTSGTYLLTPPIYNSGVALPYYTNRYYFSSKTMGPEYDDNTRELATYSGISGVATVFLKSGKQDGTGPGNSHTAQFIPGSSIAQGTFGVEVADYVSPTGGGWILPSGQGSGTIPAGASVVAGFIFASQSHALSPFWPMMRLRTVQVSGSQYATSQSAFELMHPELTLATQASRDSMLNKQGWKAANRMQSAGMGANSGYYGFRGIWQVDNNMTITSSDVLLLELGYGGSTAGGSVKNAFEILENDEGNFVDIPFQSGIETTNIGIFGSGLTVSDFGNLGIFGSGIDIVNSFLGVFNSGVMIDSAFLGLLQSGIITPVGSSIISQNPIQIFVGGQSYMIRTSTGYSRIIKVSD